MPFRRGDGGPKNLILPTITGNGQVGQTLTANPGTWVGSPSFSYQWTRDDATALSTATTYVPVIGDVGHTLTLTVTATKNSKSTVASNVLKRFGVYSSTLNGDNAKLIYWLDRQELNHANVSPDGTKLAITSYNAYDNSNPPLAQESGGSLNTEIRLIDLTTGSVILAVYPTAAYQNAWPNWMGNGDFIYTTTNTPSKRQGIAKYNVGSATSSIFYDPVDVQIGITSAHPNANGDVAFTATTQIGGGNSQGFVYIYSALGVRTQLTNPTITPITGKVLGDSAPSWSPDGTKIVCLRQYAVGLFNIIVISVGAAPGFANTSELIIPIPGSIVATDGIARWSSNNSKLITYHSDAYKTSDNGIYVMNADGTGRTRVNLPVPFRNTLVEFVPGGGSSSSAPITYAAQTYVIFEADPINTVLPVISGTVTVGQTLTASTGTWSNSPTFTYQWTNEGTAITGATASTYVLQASDLGALIGVVVTGKNSGGSVAALSALAGPAISTTVFFVANAGNDSNAGTSSGSPWQTVAKVNGASLSAGTSVLFKRGDVWREQLKPTSSGSAGNPIVFDAYGSGAAPILQGSVAASTTGDWTLISGNLWKSTTAFPPAAQATITVTIASPGVVTWTAHGRSNGQSVAFSTTGSLPTGITAGVGYYVVNKTTDTFEISATNGGASINTSGSQSGVHSAGANGLPHNNANDVGNLIWVSGGVTQTATTSYTLMTGQDDVNLTTQGQYYFNTTDWKVHVYSVGNPATAMPGLELAIDRVPAYLDNTSYITIQNINILYAAGSGLMFHNSSHMIARDMTIAWCGGGNDGGNALRAGNGADVQLTGDSFIMERCLIQQCYDAGLTIQPLVSNQPVSNVIFRNNIITNTTQGLIQIISSGATISNTSIYNNTGYNIPSWSENQRWGAGGTDESGEQFGLYHSDSGGSTMTNYNNFNNVYAGLGTSCSIRHPVPGTVWQGSGNMLLDYNLWSRSGGTTPIVCLVPAGGNPNLTAWAAGDTPPQEVHGIVGVDPAFVSQSTGDFTPAGGSPLFNAGTNLYSAGVVLDFNHKPRPAKGSFTIGAIQ